MALRRATFSSNVSPGLGWSSGGTLKPPAPFFFGWASAAAGAAASALGRSSLGAAGVSSVEASGARSATVSAPAAGEAVAAVGLRGAAEA